MSDIIPGMNEIIKYINKLEIENKTLKKSIVNLCKTNNEIEKDLEDIKELNSSWAKKRDYDGEQYRIIINELKEENNELKDKIEDSDSGSE